MNKDEAREAAWKELQTVPLLLEMDEVMNTVCDPRHRNMQMVRLGFGKGFDAGAASVDRRAIVREAFAERENEMVTNAARAAYGSHGVDEVWLRNQLITFVKAEFSGVLAEMEKEDAD